MTMRPWWHREYAGCVVTTVALLAAAIINLGAAGVSADPPFLHPLFSDHVLLQRNQLLPVWGWTTPGEHVTVALNGKTATATAADDGRWEAQLGPFGVGGPYTLTVTGPQTVVVQDVLIGDVWLCSGQSNMEMGVGVCNVSNDIVQADYPNLRLLTVPKQITSQPMSTLTTRWQPCNSTNLTQGGWGGFSAAAFFFGRQLQRELHVPIGLINSSFGGTLAEAWTSREGLLPLADFTNRLAHPDATDTIRSNYSWAAFSLGSDYPLTDYMSASNHFGVLFVHDTLFGNGDYLQFWDGTNLVQNLIRFPPGVSPTKPFNVSLSASDASDGHPWDGVGSTTISMSINETIVSSYTKGGGGYTNNYLTLEGGPVWFTPSTPSLGISFFNQLAVSAGAETNFLFYDVYAVSDNTFDVNFESAARQQGILQPIRYTQSPDPAGPGAWHHQVGNPAGPNQLLLAGTGTATATDIGMVSPSYNFNGLVNGSSTKITFQLRLEGVQKTIRDQDNLTVLYNGMIAPLVPFAIKGVVWYQGESNAERPGQYRHLLPALIEDWRSHFGQGNFPFYIVQLANFRATNAEPQESLWAELREAQALTAQNVPSAGLALAIDIGDAKDVHPKNKFEVGRRLALVALAQTYGRKVEYSGPCYRGLKISGSRIALRFDHADGLHAQSGPLRGFALAGEDHKFFWAEATIKDQTVWVSSPQVSQPVAVRYGWADNPDGNLYNRAGLPAVPFRTDDWPMITQESK